MTETENTQNSFVRDLGRTVMVILFIRVGHNYDFQRRCL
jgi:hypothetical protein